MSSCTSPCPQAKESLNVYLDDRNVEFTMKRMPNRPNSVEPRLWCAVYSRPITKTASLPSAVLIKKTAHVKSNKSSMLSVSLEEQTCSREERSASPQWKSTHRLFKAFPFLCLASFPGLSLTFAASSNISTNIQARAHRVVVWCMCLKGLIKCCKKTLRAALYELKQRKEWDLPFMKEKQVQYYFTLICVVLRMTYIHFICCFKQICPVTWWNIKAINVHCGCLKQRPGHFFIMKKEKAPSSNFMAAEASSG